MRRWTKTMAEIPDLVQAHYINDPYYPRARPTDPLYHRFKAGYMSAYPDSGEPRELGEAFLEAIEAEQAKRDSQAATN